MPLASPPTVPNYLLADPWTEDDELLLEFDFQNHVSYDVKIRKWERNWWAEVGTMLAIPFAWPFLILCGPCNIVRGFPKQKEMKEHNLVQDLWKRRVGISRNGIVYKELVTHPMGVNPTNCWQGCCCCIYDTHPALRRSKTSKTLPFEKIQDASVTDAQGATAIACCGCGCPATFPNVDSVVKVDTAGSGLEMILVGLVAPDFFKKAVLAMKNGRHLPDASDIPGVRVFDRKAAGNGTSHQVALIAGSKQTSSNVDSGSHRVPKAIEMTRTGSQGGGGGGEYRALVAAVQQQNVILQRIADTEEKNHALLEVIANK